MSVKRGLSPQGKQIDCEKGSILSINKMHQLKYNKTDHKIHFTLHVNPYVFRHQAAIFREFINNKGP